MGCRAAAIVVAAALALGALPACGSAQQPAPGGGKTAARSGGVGLKKIGEFEKPVYVTESGIAAEDDSIRVQYLKDYLGEVHQAIAEGVDVRGFFHWTSMDNFEWAHAYRMKFGLIAVDRKTLERTPKPSAGLYARMALANAVVD